MTGAPLITNGFNIMGLNPYYQDIAKGALIIFAVALSAAVEGKTANYGPQQRKRFIRTKELSWLGWSPRVGTTSLCP